MYEGSCSDFKDLFEGELQHFAKQYKYCLHSRGSEFPDFIPNQQMANYLLEMQSGFMMGRGFRKYLIYNGQLYLWFGEDRMC